ncbi:ABC transporter ATP-binding protein [Drancourtella sp. An12]|uniref:ABC transporter ATP-binding protein n=3 Tax=Clostridia TaxID=186801 RepID=UPI0031B9F2C3
MSDFVICFGSFYQYELLEKAVTAIQLEIESGGKKMYVLEVENLIRNYQKAVGKKGTEDIKVLKGLNFQVEEGDFTGIMGKSGCGKTTLLKVLGMIDKQTDGTVRFMGQDTKGLSGDTLADIRRTKLGFIFQDYYLMDSLTVEENIMLPMILGQEDAQKMMDAAKAYAEKFQIDHLLNKNPYELSGGEKQRVAICRALINNPDLILADEPTGNLDSKSGKIVIEALRTINQEMKKTIVMVTHDPQMASNCRKIILLKDGVILETLERGEKSQEEFYQEIIGKMEEL